MNDLDKLEAWLNESLNRLVQTQRGEFITPDLAPITKAMMHYGISNSCINVLEKVLHKIHEIRKESHERDSN